MRRAAGLVLVVAALLVGGLATAATRQSSIGNYYFEDDATGDRTKLVAIVGDQITFTVRQGAATPHTVEVDELDIHSGDLLIGQTYTTSPLSEPGDFKLYCRRHDERGHNTRLIVRTAPVATAEPTPRRTTAPSSTRLPAPTAVATTSSSSSPSPTASPSASIAPVGIGTAPPGSLASRTPDPDSLAGLTGVRRSNEIPWTRAFWMLLIASVPICAAGAFALRRHATRRLDG